VAGARTPRAEPGFRESAARGTKPLRAAPLASTEPPNRRSKPVYNIFYLIGVVVVVLALLSFLGIA
jgi:hypothetical protein